MCMSLLNVEPGDDGLSAWCHMHGKEFQGNMIPYGAKVYFKPSGARGIEQDHKFDPKAIPGIFAGYNLGSGNHWQRQYKVWELADFAKQNFAYDAMKPERSLLKPHITEKVVMVEPIEFPLKKEYERMNGTLEGMKDKERLDGSSMYIEDQKDGDDDDDEGGDDDGGGDKKKLKSKENTRMDFTSKNESEERIDRIREDMDKGLYPPSDDEGGEEETGSSKDKKPAPPDDGKEKLQHYSEGKPQDGIIYEDDWGERCKIDKRGRPYRVGEDGRKLIRLSKTQGYIHSRAMAKNCNRRA